jgi:hypothetical protein
LLELAVVFGAVGVIVLTGPAWAIHDVMWRMPHPVG